jgi:hypothetical protein
MAVLFMAITSSATWPERAICLIACSPAAEGRKAECASSGRPARVIAAWRTAWAKPDARGWADAAGQAVRVGWPAARPWEASPLPLGQIGRAAQLPPRAVVPVQRRLDNAAVPACRPAGRSGAKGTDAFTAAAYPAFLCHRHHLRPTLGEGRHNGCARQGALATGANAFMSGLSPRPGGDAGMDICLAAAPQRASLGIPRPRRRPVRL